MKDVIILTPEALEKLARSIAEACNGGSWSTHYLEEQKNVWRERAARVAAAA